MINTITWKKTYLQIIDQTKLPEKLKYIKIRDYRHVGEAIKTLSVRGAPAIGIAAAYGIYLGIQNFRSANYRAFITKLNNICKYFISTRPTAVNIEWATNMILDTVKHSNTKNISELKNIILRKAIEIHTEDIELSNSIGEYGQPLLKNGMNILTHCNAGGLATGGLGTALAVIYKAVDKGKKIRIYADETRPLLQGSRLTAYELMQNRIETVVICDNMAASMMGSKKIDAVIVGADRIAANGDTANKIGTYGLAILAKYHKIPFYVAAPYSTFDLSITSGKRIKIEQRDSNEIKKPFNIYITPKNAEVENPAFDVTPNKLITAIITDKGIIKNPDNQKIKRILTKR